MQDSSVILGPVHVQLAVRCVNCYPRVSDIGKAMALDKHTHVRTHEVRPIQFMDDQSINRIE